MDIARSVFAAAVFDLLPRSARVRQSLLLAGGLLRMLAAPDASWSAWGLPLDTRRRARARAAAAGPSPWPPDVRAVGWDDPDYPPGLRHLEQPPPVLFVRGRPDRLPPPSSCVAVVGSRHCTELGRALARDLAAGLSRQGITVVSGLALGIDAAAHEGAIDGGGGTVAVLASPVDDPQPKSNTALATEIAAGSGWLVSERPPLSVVRGPDFPWRNRIVAGLAGALVVVEAGLRSGTLSTVEHALAVGVDVGAVPGPATSPVSQGVHAMLKAGARVVTEVGDVLEMLGRPVADPSGAGPAGRDPDATALLAGFPGASGTDGEWLHCSRIEAGRARAALSRLLSRGELRRLPGGRVARVL